MVSIICKCSFRSGQYEVHLQLFCKLKLQSRQKGRAVTQMDCSNTLSELSFHGLPSESKRDSIRKQIASPLSLQLIILFLRNSHLQRDNQQTFFSQFFFLTFRKFLQPTKKAFFRNFQNVHQKTPVANLTLVKRKLLPVNLVKFLRTPFLQNTSGRLLLLLAFQKQPPEVFYDKRCS